MPRYRSHSNSLLDIKVNSPENGVVVLMGPPEVAPSVYLGGSIILKLNDSLSVRRISLKLYSVLSITWNDPHSSGQRPMKYERILFEHDWDSIKLSAQLLLNTGSVHNSGFESAPTGTNKGLNQATGLSSSSNINQNSSITGYGNLNNTSIPIGSIDSSHKFGHIRPASNTSGSSSFFPNSPINIGINNPTTHNYTFPAGNHEIPFEIILPGGIPETIEGLDRGTVTYKLFVTIERSKLFQATLSKEAEIRVIRTLTPDSEELGQTVAIENIWPGKVEYEVSIPSKAVAIGSVTPTNILLIPLTKGLKLEYIRITLLEICMFISGRSPPKNEEIECFTHTIGKSSAPSNSAYNKWSGNSDNYDGSDYDFSKDKWEINCLMPIPPDLRICRQDCLIRDCVRITHKLKLSIMLQNSDGHTSELRAALPIRLFISPMVPLTTAHSPTGIENNGDVYAQSLHSSITDSVAPTIFSQNLSPSRSYSDNSSTNPVDISGSTQSNVFSVQVTAPPNYHDHIYDPVFNGIPSSPEPSLSISTTPQTRSRSGSLNALNSERVSSEGDSYINSLHFTPVTSNLADIRNSNIGSHLPIIHPGSPISDDAISSLPNTPPAHSPLRMSLLPDELDDISSEENGNISAESVPNIIINNVAGSPLNDDNTSDLSEIGSRVPRIENDDMQVPSYYTATGSGSNLSNLNSIPSPSNIDSISDLEFNFSERSSPRVHAQTLDEESPNRSGLFFFHYGNSNNSSNSLSQGKRNHSLSRLFHRDDNSSSSRSSSLPRRLSPEGTNMFARTLSPPPPGGRIHRNGSGVSLSHFSHSLSNLLGRNSHAKDTVQN